MSKIKSFRWNITENSYRRDKRLVRSWKKWYPNISVIFKDLIFLASCGLTFCYLETTLSYSLSLRGRSLCLADSPHAAWRKQTAPVLLFWALLGKLLLFLTRFMCCLQIHTGGFLLKFLLLNFPGGRNPHGFVTFSGVMWLTRAEIQPLRKFSTF